MGSDPAPFFVNIFYTIMKVIGWNYESHFKKNDLIRDRKLCNMFRFIDGRNVINNGGEYDNNFKDIYPK